MPETESPAEDSAEGGEEGEVLKNHLYLPGDFPGEKEPKPGDKKSFMVDAEFVEIKNGEQCWKETTVDGVPISSEGEEKEQDMADESESTTSEAAAPDEGEEPSAGPPGKGGDFTAIILGKKK